MDTIKIDSVADKIFTKIDELKNVNSYVIFGLSNCPYCKNALKYVDENKLKYKYYNVDKYYKIFIPILEKLIKNHPELNINPSHKTFPVIFNKGLFIGGYTDLIKFGNENEENQYQ
jgi:glutaredoxin